MVYRLMDTAPKTFATRDDADNFALNELTSYDEVVRYVIVATADGRFAPCIVGAEHIEISMISGIALVG
jgi:hypothetical protein